MKDIDKSYIKNFRANRERTLKYQRIANHPIVSKILDKKCDELTSSKRNSIDWKVIRELLINGRLFIELIYDSNNKLISENQLPQHNMILALGWGSIHYGQILEGVYANTAPNGRNFIEYKPNQIKYIDMGFHGPDGINDPRSILESVVKAYNQLNAIEDSASIVGDDRTDDIKYFKNKLARTLKKTLKLVTKKTIKDIFK